MKKFFAIIFLIILAIAAVFCGVLVAINFAGGQPGSQDISPEMANEENVMTTDYVEPIILPKYSVPEAEASLIAVGDIMLSRSVEESMIKHNNFTLPFALLASTTAAADITFGNLETPIIAGRPILPGEFSFRTDPKAVAGLKFGGFDILSLANNHTANFGQAGFTSTFFELDKAGIKYVGAGASQPEIAKPVIIEKNGLKFGFLAYTYGQASTQFMLSSAKIANVNFAREENIRNDIAKLKPQVDFIIVSLHDGTEYSFTPNKSQIDFAHAAVDAGADLIIGHHPHVVETVENYQGKYIFYSLGNFIFDQLWSQETQQGLMVKIVFGPKQIKQIEFIPVKINNHFQPDVATGKNADAVISRLKIPLEKQTKFFWNGKEFAEIPSWQVNDSSGGDVDVASTDVASTAYQSADLDGDAQPEEAVIVNNIGYIIKNGEAIWQSDKAWRVDNVLIGDFNNDGKPEVGFSLWKEGSYGSSKPFWVEENDKNISNHLFLYQ